MTNKLWTVLVLLLAVFQTELLTAQTTPGKPPYTIDEFYGSVIVLWNEGNMSDDQVMTFAKMRGIAFDIDDIYPFEQKLKADPAHISNAVLSKDIKELIKVVSPPGTAPAASSMAGSPSQPAASPAGAKASSNPASAANSPGMIASESARAAALKAAADLAADTAAKAKLASDAKAAATNAAAIAAANPLDTDKATAKDTTATAATVANQQYAVAKAASEAASSQAAGGAAGTNALPLAANSGTLPFFVTSGAEFQNPYTINVNGSKASLTNTGNNTVGFVEFDYINRYAIRAKDYADDTNLFNEWTGSANTLFGGYPQAPWKHVPDFQADIGFVFDNGTTASNYTAQTLAGSGDFYADFGFGLPIWRMNDTAILHKVQVSIESSDGIVTEKAFEEVHPNAFVGLGLQSSISAGVVTNCLLSARVGCGWLDRPELSGNNSVALDNNNLPKFDFKPDCEMSTYLLVPIGGVFLTVGANTYFGGGPPDSWNIKVGATVPFSAFKSILGQ